jgi:hypothetical protein
MRLPAYLLPLLFSAALNAQSVDNLELRNVKADAVTFKGKRAIHLTHTPGATGEETLAILKDLKDFHNGTIELDVAGAPSSGSGEGARGFVGVAFRTQAPGGSKFELFYIRPTNGRAEDQLRRNHSTQYVSYPDWPWHKTRAATPGLYESWSDMEPGVWIKMKVTVQGSKARLFLNGAEQPCLIVNDLKLGPEAKGGIGFWIGPGADGYYANLKVTPGS